jgi:hypothetical protein
MEKIIKQLDVLATKATKKASLVQVQDGVSLLLDLYKQSADNKVKIADYLCTLHFSICQAFFETAVNKLQEGQIESIYVALRNSDQYKNNVGNKGTARGFVTAAVLVKNDNPLGKSVLMNTIIDVEKNNELSAKAVELFNKHVVDYCKIRLLMELGEKEWKDNTKREKYRKLLKVATGQTISTNKPEIKEQKQAEPSPTASKSNESKTSVNNEVNSLLLIAQKANNELQTMLRTIVNTNETPAALRNQISERDEQIKVLRNQINELEYRITNLQGEITKRDDSIVQTQEKNDDLTERLKKTLQLDASANNHELNALRANISEKLKLEYQDYLEIKSKECSPDLFEISKDTLESIFKKLKKSEIIFE